jgi:pimeloyl-ACP methyl ester carboxylesterase
MSAHLQWYRANIPPEAFVARPPVLPPIQAPTLGVWSSGDAALCERQMTDSAVYCAQGFTYSRLEGVGHWIPLEAAAQLVEQIVTFVPRRSRPFDS